MILRDGMVPVLVGMACGCIAAILSGRMLAALLFGVNSEDGLVLTCAGFTLIVIGMLATFRRAARDASTDYRVAQRMNGSC
jgi:hypothetical protein